MVGPEIRSGRRVHELKIYSQSAVRALNAPDDRVLHTEVRHKVCHVRLTIPIDVDVCSEITRNLPKRLRYPIRLWVRTRANAGSSGCPELSTAKGRTTSAWLRCKSVCGDHNFGALASPSATIVPIARKEMMMDAAASGWRRQNGGVADAVLLGVCAAVSTAGAGTEAASSHGSERGALSCKLTGLRTLWAAGCARLGACAGSKSPRLIASIKARVAASGETPSSLRSRSVNCLARLSAASRPL